MAQWYVKDLSRVTGVSAQTLHHYDKIGLLKPSARTDAGYRMYSEEDLLKLQQIIALKFFGFELMHIRRLLQGDVDVGDHFALQAQFLEEKAQSLLEASYTLKQLLSDCKDSKSMPWETILQLIEVYRMTQQLEKSWESKVLTPEELKQYAKFEAGLKSRQHEEQGFKEAWAALVKDIQVNLSNSPSSPLGLSIGKRCMEMLNQLYGKEHANLRTSLWENGFKKGKVDAEYGISAEVVQWLDKAIDFYWGDRLRRLLKQAEHPTDHLIEQWNDALHEMFGNEEPSKLSYIQTLLHDPEISPSAKAWLRSMHTLG